MPILKCKMCKEKTGSCSCGSRNVSETTVPMQSEATNKIKDHQQHLKTQEKLLIICTEKIEELEKQNRELQKENDELKLQVKDLEQNNIKLETEAKRAPKDIILVEQGKPQAQDYYWKNFTGIIPNDALPAGTDTDGRTTFIGKTLLFNGEAEVPGELDPTTKLLYYVMNTALNVSSENVKILCVHNPERYEWISTSIRGITFLNQNHLVAGGYNGNQCPYLIGRKLHGRQVALGKIFYEKFAYTADGEVHYVESNFEVLSYNPKLTAKIAVSKRKTSAVGNNVYHINIS